MVRKLEDFGTDKHPLHASGLQSIIKCSLRAVLHFLLQPDDESGEAADTGSAVHAAVHAWHNNGQDAAASLDAMRQASGRYRKADLNDAAALFLQYAQDPRNAQAEIVASERNVRFQLDPAPEDKTGRPIVIVGTCDQTRRVHGELRVFDIKSSTKPGYHLLMQHLYQVSAYAVGMTIEMGEPVHPGALIRVRGYPNGAFFPYSIDLKHAAMLMDALRRVVAAIRAGKPVPSPGDYCTWCVMRTMDACVPMAEAHAKTEFVELGVKR